MGAKVTGMDGLLEDLKKASEEAVTQTRKIVSKGALNIKKDAKRIVSAGGRHGGIYIPSYPNSITYETKASGTVVSAEIGPDKDRKQGPLGNLIEYGSIHNAPIPHLSPALDLEESGFADALEEMGAKLLEGVETAVGAAESG